MQRESVNKKKKKSVEIHTHYLKKLFFSLGFEGKAAWEANIGDCGVDGVQTRVLEKILSCHCEFSERRKCPLHRFLLDFYLEGS